jgi:hypothetical protein
LRRRTLDRNKNNTGMRPMENLGPAKGARVRCRELAAAGVQRLVASSLMIYLIVASAQRARYAREPRAESEGLGTLGRPDDGMRDAELGERPRALVVARDAPGDAALAEALRQENPHFANMAFGSTPEVQRGLPDHLILDDGQ